MSRRIMPRLSFIYKYNKMIESAGDYKGGIIDKN